MNGSLKNSALVILMIVVAQCGSKGDVQIVTSLPPEFSDPYLQSFRNKNLKYVLSERIIGTKALDPDTIELDRRGNIVRIAGPNGREKRAYDVNNFLVRRRLSSDIVENYIARYSIRGDTLFQSWRELNSNDWNLHGDTTTRPYKFKIFVFNQNGKVIHEFNEQFGLINYIYKKDILSYKEFEIRRDNEEEFHAEKFAEFTYDHNGEIEQIKLLDERLDEGIEKKFFYSTGLLDSSQITYPREYLLRQERYKYRYIYY
jgi:hypothetical protein